MHTSTNTFNIRLKTYSKWLNYSSWHNHENYRQDSNPLITVALPLCLRSTETLPDWESVKNPSSKHISCLSATAQEASLQWDLQSCSIRAPRTLPYLISHTNREVANTHKAIFQLFIFNNSETCSEFIILAKFVLKSTVAFNTTQFPVPFYYDISEKHFSQKRNLAKGYCLKGWMVCLLVNMKLNSECDCNCGN